MGFDFGILVGDMNANGVCKNYAGKNYCGAKD
jgi:hypothetical protein